MCRWSVLFARTVAKVCVGVENDIISNCKFMVLDKNMERILMKGYMKLVYKIKTRSNDNEL